MIKIEKLKESGFRYTASYWQYCLVMAELESKLKLNIKLLGKPRNALGRFVATTQIRCGLCAIFYCIRHDKLKEFDWHG